MPQTPSLPLFEVPSHFISATENWLIRPKRQCCPKWPTDWADATHNIGAEFEFSCYITGKMQHNIYGWREIFKQKRHQSSRCFMYCLINAVFDLFKWYTTGCFTNCVTFNTPLFSDINQAVLLRAEEAMWWIWFFGRLSAEARGHSRRPDPRGIPNP